MSILDRFIGNPHFKKHKEQYAVKQKPVEDNKPEIKEPIKQADCPTVETASQVYSPTYINEVIAYFKPLERLAQSFALNDTMFPNEETIFLGLMLGDMFGSPYEMIQTELIQYKDIDSLVLKKPGTWTDDTIMSWTTYKAIEKIRSYPRHLTQQEQVMIFSMTYRDYALQFSGAGYGGGFYNWAVMQMECEHYLSYGDGSAMRAGIIGAIAKDISECISLAVLSALPTHAHPEGIKGAVAAALLTYMASHGADKEQIKKAANFLYPSGVRTEDQYLMMGNDAYMAPDLSLEEIISLQPKTMSTVCPVTVPVAISLFLSSASLMQFYTLIQNIALDADTVGAIGGSIAAAFYGRVPIPTDFKSQIIKLIDDAPFKTFINGANISERDIKK